MVDGGKSTTGTQIRGSNMLLAGQVLASVLNLVVQVLIVRYLSQESYGAFAYALSVVLIADVIAAFGMRRGVSRYMSIYQETGDPGRTAGTLVLAIGAVLSMGLAVVLVIAGFRGAIAGSFASDTTAVTVLVLLSLLAPINALATVLDGVFAVFVQPRVIFMRKFVLTPLARLVVVALLILGNQGVVFLAIGYVATGLVGIVLYAPVLARSLRDQELLTRLRPGRFVLPTRELFNFALPQLSNDVTAVLLTSASAIAVGLIAAAADVAALRAVLPVALTMNYVLSSFGLLLVPLAARLYSRGERAALNDLYWRTAVWTGVLSFPIFLTCVVIPEPVTVLLFGERYESAAPILAVLALGIFYDTALGHNNFILGVFGRNRFLALANFPALLTLLLLLLVLVPPFAAIGGAVATSSAFIVLNTVRQVGIGRGTYLEAVSPRATPIYAAMAITTATAIALQLTLTPPTAVGIALVSAGVAVVVAVARRELALAETFPELTQVPVLRSMIGAKRGGQI